MKKLLANFAILIGILTFTGCVTYYGVGDFATETTTLIKPTFRDSTVSKNYVSATYHHTYGNSKYETYDKVQMATLMYNHGIADENSNFGFGAFINGGNFDAVDIGNLTGGNKFFVGGGVTVEANVTKTTEQFDFRFIGGKATLLLETGEYARFRAQAEEQENDTIFFKTVSNLSPDNISYNLSAYSEVIYKHEDFDMGWSVNMGIGSQILTAGAKFFVTRKKMTGSFLINASNQGQYMGGSIAFEF